MRHLGSEMANQLCELHAEFASVIQRLGAERGLEQVLFSRATLVTPDVYHEHELA